MSNFYNNRVWIPYANASKNIRTYQELEERLIQVSGFDIKKLIELFAAGYELRPPRDRTLDNMRIDVWY